MTLNDDFIKKNHVPIVGEEKNIRHKGTQNQVAGVEAFTYAQNQSLSWSRYCTEWVLGTRPYADHRDTERNTAQPLPSRSSFSFFLSIFLSLFIYIERDRDNVSGGGAERERERIPSWFCSVSTELDVGLKLTNCGIMTWAHKMLNQMLNRLSHTGAPSVYFLTQGSSRI